MSDRYRHDPAAAYVDQRKRGKHKLPVPYSPRDDPNFPVTVKPNSDESSSTKSIKHKSCTVMNFPNDQSTQSDKHDSLTPIQKSDRTSSSPNQFEQDKFSRITKAPSSERPTPYPAPPPTQDQQPPGQPTATGYPPQPQLVVQYQPAPSPPPQPYIGGITCQGSSSADKACCCHLTCCTFAWLFCDVAICTGAVLLYVTVYLQYYFEDVNPYKTYYQINFCVTGGANVLFIVTTSIGFVALCRSSTILLLIYAIRCLFVTVFQIAVHIWLLVLWIKFPFYFEFQSSEGRSGYRTFGIIWSVTGMIWSLLFVYGGWLAWRCRNYYKSLNRTEK